MRPAPHRRPSRTSHDPGSGPGSISESAARQLWRGCPEIPDRVDARNHPSERRLRDGPRSGTDVHRIVGKRSMARVGSFAAGGRGNSVTGSAHDPQPSPGRTSARGRRTKNAGPATRKTEAGAHDAPRPLCSCVSCGQAPSWPSALSKRSRTGRWGSPASSASRMARFSARSSGFSSSFSRMMMSRHWPAIGP